jgi:prophage regulatory protein
MTRHLMGAAEIRSRLGGISRQRVYQLTRHADFPAPYDELVLGRVWLIKDVEAWIREKRLLEDAEL